MTREQWLHDALEILRPIIADKAGLTVPPVRLSVGFPKGARGKKRAIGQCWNGSAVEDKIPAIFICPTLADPWEVVETLLHELLHACLPDAGHKGAFITAARSLGFCKPWTQTPSSPELRGDLQALAAAIGPYPHAPIAIAPRGSKGSRLRLWQCECEKPVKVRVASDDFMAVCLLCEAVFKQPQPGETEEGDE